MSQDRIIEATTRSLAPEPGLRALFLAGSRGAGTEDRYSDIDFLAIVQEGAAASVGVVWTEALAAVEPLVLSRGQAVGSRLINVITESWVRADLHTTDVAVLKRHGQDTLKPLHDPEGLYQTLPAQAPLPRSTTSLPYWIEEFLRILGLLPVAMGRQQHLVAITGLGLQRDLLIDLMLAENGPNRATGMFTLNQRLTKAQRATLEALPAPDLTRDSLLAAHFTMARIFLPRARRLAKKSDVPWPDAFEAATRAHLRAHFGVDYASGSAAPPFKI